MNPGTPNQTLWNLLVCVRDGQRAGAREELANLTFEIVTAQHAPDWLTTLKKFVDEAA